jgi:hypothetical protein
MKECKTKKPIVKIIPVKSCSWGCPHFRQSEGRNTVFVCTHKSTFDKQFYKTGGYPREFENEGMFPEWCPLESI